MVQVQDHQQACQTTRSTTCINFSILNMPTRHPLPEQNKNRLACQITLTGQVQGVGFRPFVYRIAKESGIQGWVKNGKGQVIIHAQASEQGIEQFIHQLLKHAPNISRPVLQDKILVPLESINDFTIQSSNSSDVPEIHTPPDYYLCHDCLNELNDPDNRRYRYPFINCTQCGPRYTIINKLP